MDKKRNGTKDKGFWKYFDEFVKVNGKLNDWTSATYEKFAALRNHLFTFDKKLTFDKFDEDGIANFIDYLGKKGMKNSTINKQLGFLRWFLRWCYEKGYHTNHTFDNAVQQQQYLRNINQIREKATDGKQGMTMKKETLSDNQNTTSDSVNGTVIIIVVLIAIIAVALIVRHNRKMR